MKRRRPLQAPQLPAKHQRILADDMERHTIHALLDQRAIVTPQGPRTHLRIGETLKTVPTPLYEEVLAERRARVLDREPGDIDGWSARG